MVNANLRGICAFLPLIIIMLIGENGELPFSPAGIMAGFNKIACSVPPDIWEYTREYTPLPVPNCPPNPSWYEMGVERNGWGTRAFAIEAFSNVLSCVWHYHEIASVKADHALAQLFGPLEGLGASDHPLIVTGQGVIYNMLGAVLLNTPYVALSRAKLAPSEASSLRTNLTSPPPYPYSLCFALVARFAGTILI